MTDLVQRGFLDLAIFGKAIDPSQLPKNDWDEIDQKPHFPAGDLRTSASQDLSFFVIANEREYALFSLSQKGAIDLLSKGSGCAMKDETITSVICLRLVTKSKDEGAIPTCVGVGYSTGCVRFFSQTGTLLISQYLHDSSIKSLRIRCSHFKAAEGDEELTIHFSDVVVSIEGTSLYAALKVCLRKAGQDDDREPPPLSYKKWKIPYHDTINDVISCGPLDFPPAGLIANDLPTVRFISGGSSPTLAYCSTTNEVRLLSAVAVVSTVATKLFSMAKNWWGGSQQPSKTPSPVPTSKDDPLSAGLDPKSLQPATKIPLTECLDDTNRAVLSIKPDPQNKMAAVSDNLGRVLLIDITSMRIVRMWKGYRQAQMAWIEVMDSADENAEQQDSGMDPEANLSDLDKDLLHERKNRIALFLAIYAPRRGLLEIWQMRQGARVAAFNIGINCQLVQAITNPLGCWLGFGAALQQKQLTQAFILTQNGDLKEIVVPFRLKAPAGEKQADRAHSKEFRKQVDECSDLGQFEDQSSAVMENLTGLLSQMKLPETLFDTIRVLPRQISPQALLHFVQKGVDSSGHFCNGDLGEFVEENQVEEHLKTDRAKWLAILNLVLYEKLLQALQALLKEPTPPSSLPEPFPDPNPLQSFLQIMKTSPYLEFLKVEKAVVITPIEKQPFGFLDFFNLELKPTTLSDQRSGGLVISTSVYFTSPLAPQIGNLFFRHLVVGDLAKVRNTVSLIHLSKISLLEMFLSWFSRYPLTALEASFNESSRSYNAMTRFLALLFDPSGDPVNHQKELFAQARMFCTSSPQFGHAFLMATLVQSTVAANGFPLPAEYGWDALVSTLEEVWQLSLRLSSPLLEQLKLSPKSFNKSEEQCIIRILAMQEIYFSEKCGQFVSIRDVVSNHHTGLDKREAELFKSLADTYVSQVHPDILEAYRCWQLFEKWKVAPSHLFLLSYAITSVCRISDLVLRNALAHWLWASNFQQKIASVMFLIEKMGKCPKERHLEKALNLTYEETKVFFQEVHKLLDHFDLTEEACNLEGIRLRLHNLAAKLPLVTESSSPTLFQTVSSSLESQGSKFLNRTTVSQHRVFVHCLQLIVCLDLKGIKLTKLFPASMPFFISFLSPFLDDALEKYPKQSDQEKEEMNKARRDFLLAVTPVKYDDAVRLADSLKVDKDPLHISQTLLLYERGEDAAGDEMSKKVRDTKRLTAGLLELGRARFASLIRDSSAHPKLKVALSTVSPEVYEWGMGAFAGMTLPKPNPESPALHPSSVLKLRSLFFVIERLLPKNDPSMEILQKASQAVQEFTRLFS